MTAEHRGWGKGYPVDRRKDMASVHAGGITVQVHRAVAELVRYLLDETVRRGYHLKPEWCWSYANRPIKGSKEPSNHSWGLAVDLNAPANPMNETLITDMPPWMPALWASWGFKWGGTYRGRKDAMHYEFTGTPQEAKALLARLTLMQDAAARATSAVPMEVPPRMNPPIEIAGKVVDVLKAPDGGIWMATDTGAIYAWECPDKGAPNRHDYWGNRKVARLEPLGDGYVVIASDGARYEFP